jgi:pyruvate dehydrogenase E1 component beta subunit
MTGTGFSTGGQHSDYLEAWFAHTAGIKVVAPSTPQDAYGLMRSAIDDPDPVLFIENLPNYWLSGPAAERGYFVPLGKARIAKEGTDVTVVSYSGVMNAAMGAVKAIEDAGVSAELIDLRTVSPWDKEMVIASVGKTGRCLIAHEAVTQFGVGAEIAAVISSELFGKLKKPVVRLGAPYSPVPFSKPLEAAYAPDAKRIAEAVINLVR